MKWSGERELRPRLESGALACFYQHFHRVVGSERVERSLTGYLPAFLPLEDDPEFGLPGSNCTNDLPAPDRVLFLLSYWQSLVGILGIEPSDAWSQTRWPTIEP